MTDARQDLPRDDGEAIENTLQSMRTPTGSGTPLIDGLNDRDVEDLRAFIYSMRKLLQGLNDSDGAGIYKLLTAMSRVQIEHEGWLHWLTTQHYDRDQQPGWDPFDFDREDPPRTHPLRRDHDSDTVIIYGDHYTELTEAHEFAEGYRLATTLGNEWDDLTPAMRRGRAAKLTILEAQRLARTVTEYVDARGEVPVLALQQALQRWHGTVG